jgi:hypothetical protein
MIDCLDARTWQHPSLFPSLSGAMRHVFLIPLLCLMAGPAAAQSASSQPSGESLREIFARGRATTTLDIDNDSLLLRRDDGLYTSGLRISQGFRVRSSGGWRTAGWRVGQQLYTPSSTRLAPEQLRPFDRPYAGWLYAGLFYRVEDADGSELAFGLDVGCLGPCAQGGRTQDALHRWLNQPEPRGWSSQIPNEVGVVAHLGGRGPYYRLGPHADLRPGIAARLGNIFTDLSGDLTLRIGELWPSATKGAAYGFLRAGVRGVVHDGTLQGGWFGSEPQRTVDPKRVTGELEAGVQWQVTRWAVRASVVGRSNEIRGAGEAGGRQEFLRLSISYSP